MKILSICIVAASVFPLASCGDGPLPVTPAAAVAALEAITEPEPEHECSDEGEEEDQPVSPLTEGEAPLACAEEGAPCTFIVDNCCDGFMCRYLDYTHIACTPLLTDGEYCGDDSECQSGLCEDYVCATLDSEEEQVEEEEPEPAELGEDCFYNEQCTEGYCEWSNTTIYGPGICRALRADGLSCSWGNECQSEVCIDERCTSECVQTGGWWECGAGGLSCCEGVCLDGGYGWGECGPRKPAGEWCMTDDICASGACVEYRCR